MAIPSIKAENQPQSPAPAVKSHKWEYLTLGYNYSYGSTTYELNGDKEVRLKNLPLHEALSALGQQGWELVSAAGTEGKLFILKRPQRVNGA